MSGPPSRAALKVQQFQRAGEEHINPHPEEVHSNNGHRRNEQAGGIEESSFQALLALLHSGDKQRDSC